MEALERDAIVRSLQGNGGNTPEAARAPGMSRATIYRKINDYGSAYTRFGPKALAAILLAKRRVLRHLLPHAPGSQGRCGARPQTFAATR